MGSIVAAKSAGLLNEGVTNMSKHVRITVLTAIAALTLSACGGSSDDAKQADKPAPKPTAKQEQQAILELGTARQSIFSDLGFKSVEEVGIDFTLTELAVKIGKSRSVGLVEGLEVSPKPLSLADADKAETGVVYVSEDSGYYDFILFQRVDDDWFFATRDTTSYTSGKEGDSGPFSLEDMATLHKDPLPSVDCKVDTAAPGC